MWRSFVTLLIISTNLCTFLNSYKIANNAEISKTLIEAYDEQNYEPQEENDSSKDSSELHSTAGRVVIGKWRNNGEALEPKWRDGDSVPLAPFSSISFQSGWQKDSDSMEDYYTEPVLNSYEKNREKNENEGSLRVKNYSNEHQMRSEGKNEKNGRGIGSSEYRNYNLKPIGHRINAEKIITTNEDLDSLENRSNFQRLPSSSYRDRGIDVNKNVKSELRYGETLENYPTEYELFESEENNPKPRKRRPPENYGFISGSWNLGNNNTGKENGDNSATVNNKTTKSQDNVELKTFLRMQTAELSLSEILQQKNLTLADLLKGKPNVINILKSDSNNNDDNNDKNNKSRTSEIKTAENEAKQNIKLNSTNSGETRWSQLQNMTVIKIDNDISSFRKRMNNSTISAIKIKNNSTAIENEKIISDSSLNIPSSSFDEAKNKSEKFQHINRTTFDMQNEFEDSKERLTKPLKNRDSSISVEINDDRNGEYIKKEDDDQDDEIMEFSDYPGKMPTFFGPVYETPIRNLFDKKNIPPSSAIKELTKPMNDLSNSKSMTAKSEDILTMNKNPDKMVNEIGTKINIMDNTNDRNEKQSDSIKNDKTSTMFQPEDKSSIKMMGGNIPKLSMEEEQQKHEKPEGISEVEKMDLIENIKEFSNDDANVLSDKNHTFNNKLRDIVIPKIDAQSRAEILELFSSGSSAERLERLLASRNMSIEELIALRQRGSSQVHFAQVFEANKEQSISVDKSHRHELVNEQNEKIKPTTMTPMTTTTTTRKIMERIVTTKAKNNLSRELSSNEEYSATDLFDLFTRNENYIIKNHSKFEVNRKHDVKSLPEVDDPKTRDSKKIELFDELDSTMKFDALPSAKNIQRDSEGSSYYTSVESVKLPNLKDTKVIGQIDPTVSSEIGRVEEIFNNNNDDNNIISDKIDYKYSEKKVLSKVRPSIIASGGILGVTIVVFLSIFIACRIRQKRKFNYQNSLAKTVFNNPVMTARKLSHTSSINSIMVDVVATSTVKRTDKNDGYDSEDFDSNKSEIDNDSLNANDSWETIPDFMK